MERDRIRQKVLKEQSRLLAEGAREGATVRFWIRQQSAADRPAPENWEYGPPCGSELQMHL